jgi:hypothetical protein
MNSNVFNATELFDQLMQINYCTTGKDLQQERDVRDILINQGFQEIEVSTEEKAQDQRTLINCGRGPLTHLGKTYHTGLYFAHHPYGMNRYPDFLIIIDGHILEIEAKSASTAVPIFTHGDTLIDPSKRNSLYIFTHITDGTEMLLPEDLLTVDNYLLLLKHKRERDVLQIKHDKEFNKVCEGKGEKYYYRPNIVPIGGHEQTNHIERARVDNLSKKVLHLLKTYQKVL